MRAGHDRSVIGVWDGAHGLLLPEVDPTDETVFDPQRVKQPERRLLFAVLADAIVRVRRLATAPRHAALELREAERWIRSDDRCWPCSFVNVCEALDIEPAALRRAVLAWRRAADGRTNVTRRALTAKKRRRTRSPAAVAASALDPATGALGSPAAVAACSTRS